MIKYIIKSGTNVILASHTGRYGVSYVSSNYEFCISLLLLFVTAVL